MKLKHSQKGVTLYSLFFYLALLAFAVFTTLKLFPVYAESLTVESTIKGIEEEVDTKYTSALNLRNTVLRRFSINNIKTVTQDDVTVQLNNYTYVVDVDYEVRVPYIKNIDLVLSFNYQAEVAAN